MLSIDSDETRELLQAAVTAVSVLGGVMAYMSGRFATRAMTKGQPPEVLAQRVNEGVGKGFVVGWPMALAALIIELWI